MNAAKIADVGEGHGHVNGMRYQWTVAGNELDKVHVTQDSHMLEHSVIFDEYIPCRSRPTGISRGGVVHQRAQECRDEARMALQNGQRKTRN